MYYVSVGEPAALTTVSSKSTGTILYPGSSSLSTIPVQPDNDISKTMKNASNGLHVITLRDINVGGDSHIMQHWYTYWTIRPMKI